MSLGLGVGSLFSVFHRLFRLASNKVSYVKHNCVCVWLVGGGLLCVLECVLRWSKEPSLALLLSVYMQGQ